MFKNFRRFFKSTGPGIITGAADDDPSGIATYSQTGAQYGFGLLWTTVFILPLMYIVQEMAARIGVVTGKGVAENIKEHYPKWILYTIVSLLVVANTINLGADLGAIASGVQLLIPVNINLVLIAVTLCILLLEIFTSYKKYSNILKWLTLSLFTYILTGLFIKNDPMELLKYSLVPSFQFNFEYLFLIVGVLGTTISPYMMFWQANEEIEEEMEKRILPRKGGIPEISWKFIKKVRLDTFMGMVFSQLTTWFIIVTTASTLHRNGIFQIETAAQAAQALEPLVQSFPNAGTIAKALFALGIIGTGILSIPIFAGGTAYAVSEMFGFKEGLNYKFKRARAFYLIIIVSTLVGLFINFLGINPIQALVYTAVINGLISVPLIGMLLLITNNKKIMNGYINDKWANTLGITAFMIMLLSAIGIVLTFFK